MKLGSRFSTSEFHSSLFLLIFLLNLKLGYLQPEAIECDWSVQRLSCPPYATTDWDCLQAHLNCTKGGEYHCLRDESGEWTEICAKPITCSKGQEPALKNSQIVCTNCKNPERYEPVDGTESYKYSECRRIRTSCPRDVTYECPVDDTVQHAQNRQCRCDHEKDYMPQNYDLNSDTWKCKEPDELNCIHAPCPEDVYGNEQRRGSDYRCVRLSSPVTAAPSKKPTERTSSYIVTQAPTRPDVPEEQTEGSPDWGIRVTLGILALMIIYLIIAVCWLKKRKQSGAPVSLEAKDVSYFELHLSWQPPRKGYIPTHYILEQREASSLIWVRIDTIPAENDTEYDVKRLKAGTLYSFRVIAKFVNGKSKPCETESAVQTKCIKKPCMPQGLTSCFDESRNCVVLRWNEIDDGGSKVLKITVEYVKCLDESESDEKWELFDSITENLNEWTTSKLTGGVMYKFRICASNTVGTSEPAMTEKIKYLDVPGKPLDVYITDVSFTKLTLNWEAPESDGGSVINKYCIRQKQGEDDWQYLQEVSSAKDSKQSKQSKTMVVNLKPLKEYYFGISARNRIGNGDYKDMELPIVLLRNTGPPENPIGPLAVSCIEYNQLTLAWQPPDNHGGLRLTEYIIEKRENRWEKVDSIPAEKTEYLVQGLKPGTLYSFRVKAKNSKGSSPGLETVTPVATLDITGPSMPVGPLEFAEMTWKSVTLKWKPPHHNGGSPITGYDLYYCKKGDKHWTLDSSFKDKKAEALVKTERTLENLTLGCCYWFRVEAKNKKDTSQPLESTEFYSPHQYMCAPSAPASVDIKDIKDSSLTVTWTAPKDHGGSKVQKYHVAYRKGGIEWEEYCVVPHPKYSCKVEKLSFDVDYFFAVWAENQQGMGDWAETKSPIAIPKTGPPSTPTGPLEVTYADSASITLSWHSPEMNGGLPLYNYWIYMKEENKNWKFYNSSSVENITITKLKQDKKYLFKVLARNKKGESDPLEMEDFISTQILIVPRPPSGPIQYSDLTQSSVTLTWNPPAKESSPINGYRIEYRSNEDLDWKEAGFETRTSWTQINLLKDFCYRFRVVSVNSKGESEPLESDIEIKPLREPDKPETIMVVDVIDYQVKLIWRPPSDDGGTDVQYYHVFLQQDNSSWKAVGRVRSDQTEFVTEILRPGAYLFGISAENRIGCGYMIESSSHTIIAKKAGVPDIPSGPIEITEVTAESVTLKWSPPEDVGDSPLESYKVYETHNDKEWKKLEKVNPLTTTYKAKRLKEGTDYKFSVIAENKQGKGARLVSETVVPCKEGKNGENCRRDRANSLTAKSAGDEKGETSTTEEEKDKKALDLLEDLKRITLWDDFQNKANELDSYTKALGFLAETTTQISGSPTMKEYNEGSESLPGGLTAYECPDYGNSLFNSVSLILFGNTSHAYRLRLIAAADGFAKLSFYKTKYFGERNKNEVIQLIHSFFSKSSLEELELVKEVREDEIRDIAIRMAVRETAMPESKCNPLQVQFLSSATGFHIIQHYEKHSEDFYGNATHELEVVQPKLSRENTKKSNGREKSYINILWVSESTRKTAEREMINRAYPVIKKED